MSNACDVLAIFAVNACRIYCAPLPLPAIIETAEGVVCDTREWVSPGGDKYYIATYQGSDFSDADILNFVVASNITPAWPLTPKGPTNV